MLIKCFLLLVLFLRLPNLISLVRYDLSTSFLESELNHVQFPLLSNDSPILVSLVLGFDLNKLGDLPPIPSLELCTVQSPFLSNDSPILVFLVLGFELNKLGDLTSKLCCQGSAFILLS